MVCHIIALSLTGLSKIERKYNYKFATWDDGFDEKFLPY